jgi:hypothetical protein
MPSQDIVWTAARLDDRVAFDKLLEQIPDGEALRAMLLQERRKRRLQAYYRETRTVRYVATDGTSVLCCAVADVEPDMASKIAAEMDAVTDVSPEALVAAAKRALGASAVRVQ